MSLAQILDEALHLKPQDRYFVIENIVKSLNEPNKEIDDIWIEESKKRLKAYKDNKVKTFSYEEVFS